MIDGAETHALKALLFNPVAQPAGHLRIEQAVSDEEFWIPAQAIGDVGIVPAVEARIDEDGVLEAELLHPLDLILDGPFDVHALQVRALRMVEWELGIEGPDFE